MTRYNPVAEAIRRRAEVGACPFCGTPLSTVKDKLVCINSECRRIDPRPRYRIHTIRPRLKKAAPSAPSSKAAARAKRREELGLRRFDPLP